MRVARGHRVFGASVFVVLSCVGYDAGIDVDVMLSSPRATVGTGIESATLLIEELELVPCESNARLSMEWGVAHAHGGEVGADVIDVLEASRRLFTTLRPAPGEYCVLRLHLGDVDRDAATLRRTTQDGDEALTAPRQDIDLVLAPRTFREAGQHMLVLRFDYTLWTDPESFASSLSVE